MERERALQARAKKVGFILVAVAATGICTAFVLRVISPPATAAPPEEKLQVVSGANGIVTFTPESGSVTFCSHTVSAEAYPRPTGSCVQLLALPRGGTGYVLTSTGYSVFISNKSSALYQCSTLLIDDKPWGSCKKL